MLWYEILALGCLGGAIPDILRIIEARYGETPAYLGRTYFWVSIILLMGIGGLVAFLLNPSGAIEALAVGYSAPELLTRLLSNKRPPTPEQLVTQMSKLNAEPDKIKFELGNLHGIRVIEADPQRNSANEREKWQGEHRLRELELPMKHSDQRAVANLRTWWSR